MLAQLCVASLATLTVARDIRIAPEGLLVGDTVRVEGISVKPSGAVKLALFRNALDFYDGLRLQNNVFLATVDCGSGRLKISLPLNDSFPSIDRPIRQCDRAFEMELRFRRYKEKEFLEMASKELGILEALNAEVPLVQAVEVTGDLQRVRAFAIDHSARLPILRNVKFGMGDLIEFHLTTADDYTTFYLNGRCRDTIPLQLIVEPQHRVITFAAYNTTRWGDKNGTSAIIEEDTEYNMTIVNMPEGIFVLLDGALVYTFEHRTEYPYKDYVELFSDPWRGSVNRIVHGKAPPQFELKSKLADSSSANKSEL